MMNKALIVHIVAWSVMFTSGYIKFMASKFSEYEHVFFVRKGQHPIDVQNCFSKIYEFDGKIKEEHLQVLNSSYKIIVSGAWPDKKLMLSLMSSSVRKLVDKTYFHFWGGDFYCYRESETKKLNFYKAFKHFVARTLMFYAFRNAAGLIFLIDGEYEKFCEITCITNKHFIAPMPCDPNKKIDYSRYSNFKSRAQQNCINVIVGNSATPTNHHEEVFMMLTHLIQDKSIVVPNGNGEGGDNNKIKVFCPLSYGDEAYRDKVIASGTRILGSDVFCPLINFMDEEDYIKFLSELDVGIFYNDRQQAMGNINMMLAMGKKLFIRYGTSR